MTLASDLPGLYGVAGASLAGCDAPALMNTLGTSGAGPAVKCVVAFPLVYHYLGAVRHTVRPTRALPAIPTGEVFIAVMNRKKWRVFVRNVVTVLFFCSFFPTLLISS